MQSMRPLFFDCNGDSLVGMVHDARAGGVERDVGVVIVVGGPQTRVGSHRQFVHLADALADAGYATLRFDTRGMGDSGGDFPGFLNLTDDIVAAIAALKHAAPRVKRVVLWGLCDGASAILLSDAALRECASGYVLVNPWVHQPESGSGAALAAQIQVKHYYLKRLTSGEFWKRLLSGGINPLKSGGEFLSTAKQARSGVTENTEPNSFVTNMMQRWRDTPVPICVLTAGDDLVAQEWLACARAPTWANARTQATTTHHLQEANHTFASAPWRKQIERWTIEWIGATLFSS